MYRSDMIAHNIVPRQRTQVRWMLWSTVSVTIDLTWGLTCYNLCSAPRTSRVRGVPFFFCIMPGTISSLCFITWNGVWSMSQNLTHGNSHVTFCKINEQSCFPVCWWISCYRISVMRDNDLFLQTRIACSRKRYLPCARQTSFCACYYKHPQ